VIRDWRMRRRVLRLLSLSGPWPPVNMAMCVRCALNGGRTTTMPADVTEAHMDAHNPDDIIEFRIAEQIR
jgi:hypothetical protein